MATPPAPRLHSDPLLNALLELDIEKTDEQRALELELMPTAEDIEALVDSLADPKGSA
jgi:hypothetical protein